MIKLGSLFDGIGAFPNDAQKAGITPIWASEIDKFAIQVTSKHFPKMKQLDDITRINGAEIKPVDIITFGSPCQGLSVAGKRKGLEDERSGLFSEAIRVIRQMRKKTNNIYPRLAVWENVAGAFSSAGGNDFRTVLQEIAETEIPMPKSGKWAAAGVVRSKGIEVAWRLLDSQYWGVPQRRKRIFLVADFRGQCAAEVLFKPESLRGNFKKSGETRERTAGSAEKRTKETVFDCRGNGDGKVACTITGDHQSRVTDYTNIAVSIDCRNHTVNDEISGTLQSKGGGGHSLNYINPVAIPFAFKSFGEYTGTEKSKSLLSCDDVSTSDLIVQHKVRRLMPVECERLMGFKDGWTEGLSDTQRYKVLGNSIAVPCAEYVLEGIAQVLREGR